jgi:indole-3-glycerol phosphate synthase
MSGPTSILAEIFEVKRKRVAAAKEGTDFSRLQARAEDAASAAESFRLLKALSRTDAVNIIAEIKKASPSKGVINEAADPGKKAVEYASSGAAAISVLTEQDHFRGSIEDLIAARAAVSLPILRKDFVFDPYQVFEARAEGADAILLIAAMLEDDAIADLMALAASLGLDSLVEVHDRLELERAKQLGARLIGVNNRNLKTFEVSLERSRELINEKPAGTLMISESGLNSPEQILELRELGFDGFLIGEALMRGDSLRLSDINGPRAIT